MALMYADACSRMNTGDILTFEGSNPLDFMINLLEDGVYSHVGMVIRSAQGELLFWDAPGGGDQFPDPYKNNEKHPGCRVALLEDILEYYMQVENPYFTWRPLLSPKVAASVPDQPQSPWDLLQTFIEQTVGAPFPGDTFDVSPEIQAWFARHFGQSSATTKEEADHGVGLLLTYLTGKVLQIPTEGSYFCAQLVAATYMAMGLLATGPQPANGYAPADFDDRLLPLSPGVELGAPVTIQWTTPVPPLAPTAQA